MNLEMHHLAPTIAKKTLDENWLRNAQKTTDCLAPDFQVRVYFKDKQHSKWEMEGWI